LITFGFGVAELGLLWIKAVWSKLRDPSRARPPPFFLNPSGNLRNVAGIAPDVHGVANALKYTSTRQNMALLNYLELSVFRPAAPGEEPERAIASVVSAGRDLFGALEHAVAELRKAGWAVDDVRRFITDFDSRHTQSNPQLKALLERALESGIDWEIRSAQPAELATA
jgi:hypothetical protein